MPLNQQLVNFFPVPFNYFTISPEITEKASNTILSEMKVFCSNTVAENNITAFCKTNDINTFQSKDNIFTNENFKFLVDEIFDCAYIYCDNTNIEVDNFEITSMWYNVYKKTGHNTEHFHPNSFLSGIFIVKDDEVDKENTPGRTVFLSPINQNFVIAPKLKGFSEHYSPNVVPKLTSGTLILFPSWLRHAVSPHPTEEYRVSIAFNLMLRGEAGRKEQLTYIEY